MLNFQRHWNQWKLEMFVIIWMHSVPIKLKFFYIYWNIIETYVWEMMEKKLIKIQLFDGRLVLTQG